MNKAVCVKNVSFNVDKFISIEAGEVVDYTVKGKRFIVHGIAMAPNVFFNYFKVTEGMDKMTYSDFEYILCNYVFTMAVLFPNEYDGQYHLVIQDAWKGTIMITANERENTIRVSFADKQVVYSTYEDALDDIRNHK